MRFISEKCFGRAVAGFISAAIFAWPAMGADNRAAIPNLSGQWGRNQVHFEQPATGVGPIFNTMRTKAGVMDNNQMVGDYKNPLLKPWAADVVKKLGEISLSGVTFPDPHNQCAPEPVPFTISTQFGIEIIQQKDEVHILYVGDHKVRHIRMNASHPNPMTPSWQGDSVGHYEGDTLVIDTVGQKVVPLSMVDQYGTPYTDALHVIERYRLVDGQLARDAAQKHEHAYTGFFAGPFNPYGRGDLDPDASKKGLKVEITVEDEGAFTTPWSALVTYRPVIGDWPEAVCAENTREYYANRDTAIPMAAKPDF